MIVAPGLNLPEPIEGYSISGDTAFRSQKLTITRFLV